MSIRHTTSITSVIAFLVLFYPFAMSSTITGPELWEKVIGYHDPDGKWSTFKGKVHLVSTFGRNQLAGEIITIDNDDDLYQMRKLNNQGTIVGVTKGKAFASFENPPENKEISEQRLQQMRQGAFSTKQHHSGHIGMPMQMKVAGLTAMDKVEIVKFKGRSCYALILSGGDSEGPYDYWRGTWILYVDPETYAMCGARSADRGYPSRYFECLGEIEVDGIKFQEVKNYYLSEDDSHIFTDVFAPAD